MQILENIKTIERERGCTIGLVVWDDTHDTPSYTFREQEEHASASAIKLFVAGAVAEAMGSGDNTLERELPVRAQHFVTGASVLADLTCSSMSVKNLLYLLLAHSDTSAQNVLEQIVSPAEINEYLARQGYKGSTYVPKGLSNEAHHSRTTPLDSARCIRALWRAESCSGDMRTFLLSCLAQSRHTHYGLRYLPSAENARAPRITAHYTKAGKIHHSVNDTLLLETDRGVVSMSVFVDGLQVQKNFNSVDHEGILLVSTLVRDLFEEWYGGLQGRVTARKN
jgi:beta-lactamase class A